MANLVVERIRTSVTQGEIIVTYKGVEVAAYGDNIQLIESGESYYGEIIGGWASIVPDEVIINSLLGRPTKKLSELLSIEISSENFELTHQDDELHVHYRDVYITTYEVKTEPLASHFINYTIAVYREKLERIERKHCLKALQYN